MEMQKKQTDKKEISSGVIIFRLEKKEPLFLILYRGKSHWTFPRGKIENEERSFEAALRETREETGLSRSDFSIINGFKAYEHWVFTKHRQRISKTVIFYLGETKGKNVRLEPDFEGYGWFVYREALRIFSGEKNKENRKVLRQAYGFLKKKHKKRKEGNDQKKSA